MSLLQEYEAIRRDIGEKRFEEIEAFLNAHPHYLLDDVYYREKVWDESVEWARKTFGKSAVDDYEKKEEIPF